MVAVNLARAVPRDEETLIGKGNWLTNVLLCSKVDQSHLNEFLDTRLQPEHHVTWARLALLFLR